MKSDDTIYHGDVGNPDEAGGREVWVDKLRLSLAASTKIRNHSPDGYNWGFGGSGPAQLAIALCLDFLEGDADRAQAVYQDFKFAIVAKLHQRSDWQLTGKQIREAIEAIEAGRRASGKAAVSE